MTRSISEATKTNLFLQMREAPRKASVTIDSVLIEARQDIKRLLDLGYSFSEIQDLWKETGVPVSIAKLKAAAEPKKKNRRKPALTEKPSATPLTLPTGTQESKAINLSPKFRDG